MTKQNKHEATTISLTPAQLRDAIAQGVAAALGQQPQAVPEPAPAPAAYGLAELHERLSALLGDKRREAMWPLARVAAVLEVPVMRARDLLRARRAELYGAALSVRVTENNSVIVQRVRDKDVKRAVAKGRAVAPAAAKPAAPPANPRRLPTTSATAAARRTGALKGSRVVQERRTSILADISKAGVTSEEAHAVLDSWWSVFGPRPVAVLEALRLCQQNHHFTAILARFPDSISQRKVLGILLRAVVAAAIDHNGNELTVQQVGGATVYAMLPVARAAAADGAPTGGGGANGRVAHTNTNSEVRPS